MTQPVDIRDYRANDYKITALEKAKAALQKHHDHMRTHYAELQDHLAVVDEQLQMADTAMKAIDAQLLTLRGVSQGITDMSKQEMRPAQSEESAAMERARMFAAHGRFKLPRYEDLRTGDGEPLPPQDERGKRIDALTQEYLEGMKQ